MVASISGLHQLASNSQISKIIESSKSNLTKEQLHSAIEKDSLIDDETKKLISIDDCGQYLARLEEQKRKIPDVTVTDPKTIEQQTSQPTPTNINKHIPWIVGLGSIVVGLLGYILTEQKVKGAISGLGALGLGATITSLVKNFKVEGNKTKGWLEGKGAWITGLVSAGLAAIPLYLTDDKLKGSLLTIGGGVLGGLLGHLFEPVRQAVGLPTTKQSP